VRWAALSLATSLCTECLVRLRPDKCAALGVCDPANVRLPPFSVSWLLIELCVSISCCSRTSCATRHRACSNLVLIAL
jgi:hypothetical protein